MSEGLLDWLGLPESLETLLRKSAHFCAFLVLGMLISGALTRLHFPMPLILLAVLVCACADETIQLFSEGRSSELRDVWIDLSGGTLCTLSAAFFYKYKKRKPHGLRFFVFLLSDPEKELHTFQIKSRIGRKRRIRFLTGCKDRTRLLYFCCRFCCFTRCFSCCRALGHGIVAVTAPRMTAEKTADCEVETLEWSVLSECFESILGTGRSESAGRLL